MCLEFFNETCDSQITLQLYIHVFCNDAFPLRSNFTPVGEITVTQTTTFRQTLMSSFTFPAETVFHKPFCVLRGHFVTIIFSGVTQKLFQTPMIMQSAWFKYYPFWSEWRMAKTTYTKKKQWKLSHTFHAFVPRSRHQGISGKCKAQDCTSVPKIQKDSGLRHVFIKIWQNNWSLIYSHRWQIKYKKNSKQIRHLEKIKGNIQQMEEY